jgi:hypothetical protein
MSKEIRRPVSMVAVTSGLVSVHSDPDYGRMGPTRFYALCSDGTMWTCATGGTVRATPAGWQQMESIPGTAATELAHAGD